MLDLLSDMQDERRSMGQVFSMSLLTSEGWYEDSLLYLYRLHRHNCPRSFGQGAEGKTCSKYHQNPVEIVFSVIFDPFSCQACERSGRAKKKKIRPRSAGGLLGEPGTGEYR